MIRSLQKSQSVARGVARIMLSGVKKKATRIGAWGGNVPSILDRGLELGERGISSHQIKI